MREFDVVIVGAGSAGYVSAIRAAQLGKQVALIERDKVGGTCLNRGCIPTKTLLHSAEVFYQQKEFELLGIESSGLQINPQRMNQRKDEVVHQLREGIEQLLRANQVSMFFGSAEIVDEHLVRVGDEFLSAKNILIATGSSIATLPIPGIEVAYTSDDILDFSDKLFTSVVIVGGGVIGVEFAMLYQQLGTKVTIIETQDRLLSQFDKEISQNLSMILKRRGVSSICGGMVSRVDKQQIEGEQANYTVTYVVKGEEKSLTSEAVIVAVGRKANGIDSLVPLKYDKTRLVVNEYYQSNVASIYAVGDASSVIQLAHLASHQGIAAINHMFGIASIKTTAIPMCVYTNPEIACVGLTEVEAKAAGYQVVVGKYATLGNGKTIIEHQDRGFVKIVVEELSRLILGAQLMCDRASDMITIFTQAIESGLTIDQMQQVVYPHPSFSEAIHEAICDVSKEAIHCIPKK